MLNCIFPESLQIYQFLVFIWNLLIYPFLYLFLFNRSIDKQFFDFAQPLSRSPNYVWVAPVLGARPFIFIFIICVTPQSQDFAVKNKMAKKVFEFSFSALGEAYKGNICIHIWAGSLNHLAMPLPMPVLPIKNGS